MSSWRKIQIFLSWKPAFQNEHIRPFGKEEKAPLLKSLPLCVCFQCKTILKQHIIQTEFQKQYSHWVSFIKPYSKSKVPDNSDSQLGYFVFEIYFLDYSHFCSISFISSGGIFNLSICSLTTLAHFCKESKAVQGFDISTTNVTRVSFREMASSENLRRPLWYGSPSKIHTLHLVWSTTDKRKLPRQQDKVISSSN